MSRTIIITGASRGIGRAAALAFAKPGNNIVINCVKNAALLNEVKDEIIARGANCVTFLGDVSQFETAGRLFETAVNEFGSVDVLINNAGISIIGLFQDLERCEWERIMNTNAGSVYNCCHFAIPEMLKKHSGKIINISSVWGVAGASCEVAYSASKGAVNSLTKALAKELAPSNIQVNAIACGAIDTDMNSFLTDEDLNALNAEIPAGRMGTPQEAAAAILMLANSCDYLTGQIITLDGGWI